MMFMAYEWYAEAQSCLMEAARLGPTKLLRESPGFPHGAGANSHHTGGCFYLRADGSVNFVSQNMDLATYQQLENVSDSLTVGGAETQ